MILFLLFDEKKKDKVMVAIISIILSKSTCMIAWIYQPIDLAKKSFCPYFEQ